MEEWDRPLWVQLSGDVFAENILPGPVPLGRGDYFLGDHMLQLTNPKFIICSAGDIHLAEQFSGGIYPACKGLSSDCIKKVIKGVLERDWETLKMDTPIRYVSGVGPKRAKLFNKLDVFTVEDLLNHFPREWILPTDITDIGQLEPGKNVTVVGEITKVEYISYGRMPRMKITIDDGTGELQAIWFNGGWLRNQLKIGKMIMMTGKTELVRR